MSPSPAPVPDHGPSGPAQSQDPNPTTVASFSPATLSHTPSILKQRSTVLVHQKSPLLVATPPQVTRALAYSHPFLLPTNKLAGLLSWSSGDPWESFLLVAGFWAVVLYGDIVLRWAGPLLLVVALIAGMYSRRYSPLSSTAWTGEKRKGHKREDSDLSTKHHKSLDEIVETLRVLTTRCNILLEPLLLLTDFLSTQRTATSATTRPALTRLFLRIIVITPLWIVLTLPPFYIITSRRVVLTGGTLLLCWHSRPARVSRVLLWRSVTIQRLCSVITGLNFTDERPPVLPTRPPQGLSPPPLPPRTNNKSEVDDRHGTGHGPESTGVRFTFILYENQRRWLGVGWTHSLLAYERAAWTDEHLNPAPSKDEFRLPEVEGASARWRWVEGSEWRVEGAGDGEEGGAKGAGTGRRDSKGQGGGGGWIYYDNKWNDGRRGQDSWGRYTRRRKWYRDAELVEVTASSEGTPNPSSIDPTTNAQDTTSDAGDISKDAPPRYADVIEDRDDTSSNKALRRRHGRRSSATGSGQSTTVDADRGNEDERPHVRDSDWLVSDDAGMGFG